MRMPWRRCRALRRSGRVVGEGLGDAGADQVAGGGAAAIVEEAGWHPARTANVSGHGPRSPARDRTITLVKQLGRRQWKKASGYHRQGRMENTFFRYKSIIGDGLRARSPAGQGSEVVLGCAILNRMTALGRPASYYHARDFPCNVLFGGGRGRDGSREGRHGFQGGRVGFAQTCAGRVR